MVCLPERKLLLYRVLKGSACRNKCSLARQPTELVLGVLQARVYDDKVREFVEGVGLENIGKRLVNNREKVEFVKPEMSLDKLLKYGQLLVDEQARHPPSPPSCCGLKLLSASLTTHGACCAVHCMVVMCDQHRVEGSMTLPLIGHGKPLWFERQLAPGSRSMSEVCVLTRVWRARAGERQARAAGGVVPVRRGAGGRRRQLHARGDQEGGEEGGGEHCQRLGFSPRAVRR